MSNWHLQGEVDDLVRSRVAKQLSEQIAAYDGSPPAAKEILRGLAAARMLGLDLGPSEEALAERHRQLGVSAA